MIADDIILLTNYMCLMKNSGQIEILNCNYLQLPTTYNEVLFIGNGTTGGATAISYSENEKLLVNIEHRLEEKMNLCIYWGLWYICVGNLYRYVKPPQYPEAGIKPTYKVYGTQIFMQVRVNNSNDIANTNDLDCLQCARLPDRFRKT